MTQKSRLDQQLVIRGLVSTRSQAESYIKLGKVTVSGKVVTKPGFFVSENSDIRLKTAEQYVSRAALKLASVALLLKLQFKGKVVLDVGSSTGGFTDFALKNGAKKVIAVDVGTEQLHQSLRGNKAIDLYEKTDIRNVSLHDAPVIIQDTPNIIVIDVSFISLRDILPHIAKDLSDPSTCIVAMVKPQFEAGKHQVNKGVIKNDSVRRDILRNFELWSKEFFMIVDKADSEVAGGKGNRERFYLLKTL